MEKRKIIPTKKFPAIRYVITCVTLIVKCSRKDIHFWLVQNRLYYMYACLYYSGVLKIWGNSRQQETHHSEERGEGRRLPTCSALWWVSCWHPCPPWQRLQKLHFCSRFWGGRGCQQVKNVTEKATAVFLAVMGFLPASMSASETATERYSTLRASPYLQTRHIHKKFMFRFRCTIVLWKQFLDMPFYGTVSIIVTLHTMLPKTIGCEVKALASLGKCVPRPSGYLSAC